MKTYYELLDVAPGVPAETIKRAFRREIARYHPDKVQHLGTEFQEIAAVRAAELTEAYRVLMDEEARRRYDEQLEAQGVLPAAPPASVRPTDPRPAGPAAQPSAGDAQPAETAAPDRRFHQARITTSDFVRKAALGRLREAVSALTAGGESVPVRGMDAAFRLKATGGLFRRGDPAVRLLAKFVPLVDAAAIAEVWPLLVSISEGDELVCALLLGGGLAPARELSVAVAEQRRKARKAGPVVVPVDVRDWEALFPPEAPASVRGILQRLREGKA